MKVAVLYPHADLLERKSGASLRVSLLVDFLSQHADEVRTFSPFRHTGIIQIGQMKHTFWAPFLDAGAYVHHLFHRLRVAGTRFKYPQASNYDINLLLLFEQFPFQKRFQTAIHNIVSRCDVVFLEYSFWATDVLPICKDYAIPTVLTTYDFLPSHTNNPEIQRFVLDKELQALHMADYAICVSEVDLRTFQQYGLQPRCIINPIDTRQCQIESDSAKLRAFRKKYGLDDFAICMFIGSWHPPNVRAIAVIEQIAAHLPTCLFVIAGGCVQPDRQANVVKLGKISPEDLQLLYSIADITLMPLQIGSGSSLKFAEALAYGKVIIASSVAVRGYQVLADHHVLISDDFDSYPRLILEVLSQPTFAQELSTNARELANQYDYRTVFEPYRLILQRIRSHSGNARGD